MYVDQAVLDLTGIHLTLFSSAGLKVCALHPVHDGQKSDTHPLPFIAIPSETIFLLEGHAFKI